MGGVVNTCREKELSPEVYLGGCVTKAYLLRAISSSPPGESERGLVVVGLDMGLIVFYVWRCGKHRPGKRTLSASWVSGLIISGVLHSMRTTFASAASARILVIA